MELYEIYLSSGPTAVESDGLIWKEILPEGHSEYTPTPLGPVKRPFKVVASGPGDLENGVASLEEIKRSFEEQAFENVQVILGKKPKTADGTGGDHEDITINNTGFVRKLRIEDKPGTEGKKRLMAGIEFTEPDVKERVERGTFANCSSGIVGGVVNKHTGKEFGQALKHLAITNSPWVGGMEKFGSQIMAADDEIDGAVSINLDAPFETSLPGIAPAPEETQSGVVWKEENSSDWLRDKISGGLKALVTAAAPDEPVYFYVKDVAPTEKTALVVRDGEQGSGETYVVPYDVHDGEIAIANPQKWTQTRQVHIAAADELSDDQLRTRIDNALHLQLRLGDDYEVVSVGKEDAIVKNTVANQQWRVGWDLSADRIWLDPTTEWEASEGTVTPREEPKENEERPKVALSDDDSPEGRLRAAREKRGLLGNGNKTGGNQVGKLDLTGLNLSDEQRTALEAQFAEVNATDEELKELRRKERQREVTDKIAELSDAGFKDNPGVLKYIQRLYLSDDKAPSVVLLADEDDPKDKGGEISLSDALDGLFERLKNQQGKIELSTQSFSREEEGQRPPANAEGENKTHAELLAEAADVLGLPQREPVVR